MEYSRLVYSTDNGPIKPDKSGPPKRRPSTSSGPKAPSVPNDGIVRVFRDRGGRKGKTVTLVTGIPAADVSDVTSALKKAVAAGGLVRDGAIELQGDHRELIVERLNKLGYKVKVAGG